MKEGRVSIAGLMLAVVAIAAALAALARPSATVATLAYSIAFFSLGVAVGGAISGRGRGRVAWGGYLAFAGLYFLMCFAPWFRDIVEPRLPLSQALDVYYLDWMRYRPTTPGEEVYVSQRHIVSVERSVPRSFERGRYQPEIDTWNPERSTYRIDFDGTNPYASMVDCPSVALRPCSLESLHQVGHSLGVMAFGMIGVVGAGIVVGRERRATATVAIGVDPPIEASL
jgi:hypothetical protein